MPDVFSAASATDAETVAFDVWWLKDPTDPTLNIRLRVDGGPQIISPQPHGVFAPLGADTQIVTADTPKGDVVDLVLSFLDKAAFDALAALRATGRTLLLQSKMTRQWYVAMTGELASVVVSRNDTTEQRSSRIRFTETEAA